MEALLRLLLNLFAICILNKIPCAEALSTFVALTSVCSGSGTVMSSPWTTGYLQMTHWESLNTWPQPGSHLSSLFGVQVSWAEKLLQMS